MAVKPTTDAERLGHHLKYEIEMLCATFSWAPSQAWANWARDNALKESFYVHARGLHEFLEKEAKKHEYTDTTFVLEVADRKRAAELRALLNMQVAHLGEDGRTQVDGEKLNNKERQDLVDILTRWVDRFRASLLPLHKGIPIPRIDGSTLQSITACNAANVTLTPGPQGATNAIGTAQTSNSSIVPSGIPNPSTSLSQTLNGPTGPSGPPSPSVDPSPTPSSSTGSTGLLQNLNGPTGPSAPTS